MNKAFAISFVLIILSNLSGCQQKEVAQEYAGIYVSEYAVDEQPISASESFYGEITSQESVAISSTNPGIIQQAPEKNGINISRGDLLFKIENKDLQAQLSNGKAALEVSKANLEKIRAGASAQEVMAMEENVQAAKVKYDETIRNKERLSVLFESGAVSKQQLDQAETELNIAKTQYNSLQHQLEQLKMGPTQETIHVAESQYEQAKIAYTSLSSKMDDLVIESPISGFITDLKVEKGEFVGTGMLLATIQNIDQVFVEVNIPDLSFLNLKLGEEVEIKISTINQIFSGKIIELNPQADPKTKLFKVKIVMDNKNGILKPGMTAVVNFSSENKTKTMTVPVEAVINDKGENIVFVIENGIAKKRVIQTGIQTNVYMEVISGLEKGEKIILDGVEFVRDGDQVQVIKKEDGK